MKVQTLDEISQEVFNDKFIDLNYHEEQAMIISIQKNQILQQRNEIEEKRNKYIDRLNDILNYKKFTS